MANACLPATERTAAVTLAQYWGLAWPHTVWGAQCIAVMQHTVTCNGISPKPVPNWGLKQDTLNVKWCNRRSIKWASPATGHSLLGLSAFPKSQLEPCPWARGWWGYPNGWQRAPLLSSINKLCGTICQINPLEQVLVCSFNYTEHDGQLVGINSVKAESIPNCANYTNSGLA